jgi:hypothetical protein
VATTKEAWMETQQPVVGSAVLFALPEGPHRGEPRPAIVTSVHRDARAPRVNLQWFTDADNDGAPGARWAASVPFDVEGRPGTWRWAQRA